MLAVGPCLLSLFLVLLGCYHTFFFRHRQGPGVGKHRKGPRKTGSSVYLPRNAESYGIGVRSATGGDGFQIRSTDSFRLEPFLRPSRHGASVSGKGDGMDVWERILVGDRYVGSV
ncbi:uncharacterized protein F4807DRAFT_416686 [Annulohypoxylon truncatum]|uniref:uncharacterized protein n=1 Tax=Annulohypoxylon truncatum TaxID=327061 RepID=UPI002007E7FE|nr:uncharacterized protein F4807DRAFT_416686 [Annulohypoxylon truncatum]KAI1211865.1 hypothetical protein F4807DRAFT_416686 [Annulohypoxylon truncatum]